MSTTKTRLSLLYLGVGALSHNIGFFAAILALIAGFFGRRRVHVIIYLSFLVGGIYLKSLSQDILVALDYFVDPYSDFFGVKSTESIVFNIMIFLLLIVTRRDISSSMENTRRLLNVSIAFTAVSLIFYDLAMIGGRLLFMGLPLLALYLGFKNLERGKFNICDWLLALALVGLTSFRHVRPLFS